MRRCGVLLSQQVVQMKSSLATTTASIVYGGNLHWTSCAWIACAMLNNEKLKRVVWFAESFSVKTTLSSQRTNRISDPAQIFYVARSAWWSNRWPVRLPQRAAVITAPDNPPDVVAKHGLRSAEQHERCNHGRLLKDIHWQCWTACWKKSRHVWNEALELFTMLNAIFHSKIGCKIVLAIRFFCIPCADAQET